MTANALKIQNLSLVGGRLCLDFTNTVSWRGSEDPKDLLQSYEDLVTWGVRAGLLGSTGASALLARAGEEPEAAANSLVKAKALRETIARIYDAVASGGSPKDADLSGLTTFLREALSHVQLCRSESGYGIGFEKGDSLDQFLPPIAWSAAELLRDPALTRVKCCSGKTCGWLFVDSSKNHSRRWCEMKDCGNREKARRHYHKTRAQGSSSG